jgi:hypothetical protein
VACGNLFFALEIALEWQNEILGSALACGHSPGCVRLLGRPMAQSKQVRYKYPLAQAALQQQMPRWRFGNDSLRKIKILNCSTLFFCFGVCFVVGPDFD